MKAYLSSIVTKKWIRTRKKWRKKEKKKERNKSRSDPTRFACTWWWGEGGPVAVSGWSPPTFAAATPLSQQVLWDDFTDLFSLSGTKKEGGGEKTEMCGGIVFNDNNYVNFFFKEVNYNLMNNKK